MEPQRCTDRISFGEVASWRVPGPLGPVVCVHGAGVSTRQTMPLLRRLSGRVEAWGVDLPGYGKSTSPGGFLAVPELADALLEWTRAREMDRPCLLGVSMGSQVVAEAAALAPDDVGSVVLAAPTTDPRGRAWPLLGARLIWNNMLEGADVLSYSVPDYWDAGAGRVLRSWAQSRKHRLERVLPDVSQPALVVWGSQDKVCSQAWVEEATRLLPRGRLVVLPGQYHALSSTGPRQLADAVQDFVGEREEAS
ncbi:alpha/beta fold hydrolase [Nocardiopsis metallicus]|uniref:Pimeloyl-ACP methyl ester carboxylesterase n=1 Tax=Nocardiopsis metallicus TaxID=179819 RepID=A0A840WDK6_9ACTN|nr:alpha/beta hydrolase [Nocardiopsis metallicus]MBB5494204.1 pimeloyl-ACP methyl ester carboxylesterase [Nocardiopsis metallicus]